jgi:IS30 family transposase
LTTEEDAVPQPFLTRPQRQRAWRLKKSGLSQREIARELDCTLAQLRVVRKRGPGTPRVVWTPREGRLSADEREQILVGLGRGDSMSAIARQLDRAPSTVTREVGANGGVAGYGAQRAHVRAERATRRPKPWKLESGPLLDQVTAWLLKLWSPEEIAGRLRDEFPGDPMMHVSHETIYQSLFVQGRGELRRELARCLRSGRTQRKPQGGSQVNRSLPNMVMISERPAEVDDRAVPGHWEGDLILGKNGRSAVGTLVERSTRFVLLLHLPDGRSPAQVAAAMAKAIRTLPRELARSVTWDQGKEMAMHRTITVKTGVPIYFCDPHSPWQRGSNENTNGLLRQYMPKGTDLSSHSAADLRRFQRSLNGRPRETLGWKKPEEKLTELLALTG